MAEYTPHTQQDIKKMMKEIKINSISSMYDDIPSTLKYPDIQLSESLSEGDERNKINKIASKNRTFNSSFMGAGTYRHYIPSSVMEIQRQNHFLTSKFNYAQGLLQAVYECQKMVSDLVGMDRAYIGYSDVSSAVLNAMLNLKKGKRNKILISELVKPQIKTVLNSYFNDSDIKIVEIESLGLATTNTDMLIKNLDEDVIAVYIEQPNFFGTIEDMQNIAEIIHSSGAKLVVGVYPISLGFLKGPDEYNADMVVGDLQSLGLTLSAGSSGCGFLACKNNMKDIDQKGYVVKKESENGDALYSLAENKNNTLLNKAHMAIPVGMYLARMGKSGIKKVAQTCIDNAHYFQFALAKAGIGLKYRDEFFNEFVTLSKCTSENMLNLLAQNGILGGHKIGTHEILWCATEFNSRAEMDRCAEICGEANK